MKNSALLVTGTLTMTPPGTNLAPRKMVFQRVRQGLGNILGRPHADLQLRAHVVPADPKTTAQIARRDLMAAAVTRWHASTASDKSEWKIIAENRSISVFNACISDTLNNYELVAGILVKK
jgi:hypothetical protein